jgi:hypothetical protein
MVNALSMSSPKLNDLRQAGQFGAFLEVKLFHSPDDGASVEWVIQIGYSHGRLDGRRQVQLSRVDNLSR